jgi:cytochrome P450
MRKPKGGYRFPPGPKGRPLLGNLLEFRRDPTGFSQRLARDYGDAAHFTLGRQHFVQLNSPEFIHDVLVTHHRQFRKAQALEFAEAVIGNGLVRSEGDFHRRQRRLIQPAFQQERMASYAPAVVQSGVAARQRWQDGQTVDMLQEMLRVTVSVAAKALFSADVEADFAQISSDLTVIFEYFHHLISPFARLASKLPTPHRRRFLAARHRLDDLIYGMVRSRRAGGAQPGDLLGMLLAAQDIEGDGRGMNDRQVRDEAMTMFVAGHETTAAALTWTFFLLSEHPAIESRLHGELDKLLAGRLPTFADLERLSYTRMVVAESMRLYPPVWAITRHALVDYRVGEWLLPAGTTIGMSQYVMHRDPRFYPDPERFDPLRWTEEEVAMRPKYSYFPFGGGTRLCIGERLAWMEAALLLATICQKWRAKLVPGHQVRLQPLIALRPRGGMPVRLQRRSDAERHIAEQAESAPATLGQIV